MAVNAVANDHRNSDTGANSLWQPKVAIAV